MQGIFLITACRTALGLTQPPIQWVPGALSLGVKRPGHEADTHLHLVQRSKNERSYSSTLQYAFMAWCSVKKSTGTSLPSSLSVSRSFNGYRGLFPRVKRPRRETNYSPPYNAKFNNTWSYTSIPSYVLMASYLIKHRIYLHGAVLG
jgi:hypothetical protein